MEDRVSGYTPVCKILRWGEAYSLYSISQDYQANQDAHCPIQVPDCRMVPENLRTDEDGKTHDPPDEGIETCQKINYISSCHVAERNAPPEYLVLVGLVEWVGQMGADGGGSECENCVTELRASVNQSIKHGGKGSYSFLFCCIDCPQHKRVCCYY